MKLVLYDEKINDVPKSGSYQITNAIIYESQFAGFFLVANMQSIIQPLATSIEPTDIHLSDLKLLQYKFPPVSLKVTKQFACLACKAEFINTGPPNASLIKCAICSTVAKVDAFLPFYTVKFTFLTESKKTVEVSMYRHQTELYFNSRKLKVPKDEDEFTLVLFSDETTVLLCNNRNVVYGIKE